MSRCCFRQQDCKSQGVTLIELLIVMAILVVIAGLGLPSVMRMVDRSRLNSATRELQAELNRTRLEAMKSGEPLVFHYQSGTGCYEIMSKQQYDLRFPRQRQTTGLSASPDSFDDAMSQNALMGAPDLQLQAAGSTGPTLADHGETSLADSLASQSSLADRGTASTLADRGPGTSFADRMIEPDMQMIAATPVSKFLPVQKNLPHEFVFANGGAGQKTPNADYLANTEPGTQSAEFGMADMMLPQAALWSEPIFFFPNGRTSNAAFAVCTPESKRSISISVRGLTGTARIGQIEVMP